MILAMLKKIKFVFLFSLALGAGLFFIFFQKSAPLLLIDQSGNEKLADLSSVAFSEGLSPISGLPCENYQRRPLAVMLANDSVARPLSGLSEADLVIEMPVITGSMTRLMAVFVCNSPSEIGSVRSARHDFIPLAQGLDAIYAHWGGSHFALGKLNRKVMDNLDALVNPFGAFYRKSIARPPHNGFTSLERLISSAQRLNYRLKGEFDGYPHQAEIKNQAMAGGEKKLIVGYAGSYRVEWQYESAGNIYRRWRAGMKEIDRNNNQQVEAKNVIIMRAVSRQIEGQYNDVEVEGEGQAEIYQNGQLIRGAWRKDKKESRSKLSFFDEQGEEIKFAPGAIWIEIIQPTQEVKWQEIK